MHRRVMEPAALLGSSRLSPTVHLTGAEVRDVLKGRLREGATASGPTPLTSLWPASEPRQP
jgi:hypothetical protein